MKKFKLGVLAMALVSMLGFTSCLDGGETSTTGGGYEIVKVNNFMGLHTFTTQYGVTLTPLNTSQVETWPTTEFAYIGFTYEQEGVTENGIDVTLFGMQRIPDGRVIPNAPTEADANAGIYSLSSTSNSQFVYGFYQLNDLFLYMSFYIRNVEQDDMLDEIDTHQFSLYYDPAEDFTSSSMTLYLRHNVTNMAEDDQFRTLVEDWRHFDLSPALSSYKAAYGKEPTNIIISYEQSTDGSYEDNRVSDRTAEFNYTDAVNYYKQWLESQEGNNNSDEE